MLQNWCPESYWAPIGSEDGSNLKSCRRLERWTDQIFLDCDDNETALLFEGKASCFDKDGAGRFLFLD